MLKSRVKCIFLNINTLQGKSFENDWFFRKFGVVPTSHFVSTKTVFFTWVINFLDLRIYLWNLVHKTHFFHRTPSLILQFFAIINFRESAFSKISYDFFLTNCVKKLSRFCPKFAKTQKNVKTCLPLRYLEDYQSQISLEQSLMTLTL